MIRRKIQVFLVALALGAGILGLVFGQNRVSPKRKGMNTGLADSSKLLAAYTAWKVRFESNGGVRNLTLRLGWSPAVSSGTGSSAFGVVSLDLLDGRVTAEIRGLPPAAMKLRLWLIRTENYQLPPAASVRLQAGTFYWDDDGAARLKADLGRDAFSAFTPRTAIVTESDDSSDGHVLLAGTTTLFQSLYFSERKGRLGVIEDGQPRPDQAVEPAGFLSKLVKAVFPVSEAQGPPPGLTALVAAGRDVFLNETFGGNGRTCATCHREELSFTLNPQFIATLPPTDPLFVAETNPNLAQLENPAVMRGAGCILENHDGFDKPGVLRGIPHLLGLGLSTKNPFGDLTAKGITEALGWSGDGAPLGLIDDGAGGTISTSGTLRDFAIGAVRQHLTKTLNRRAGVDFVYPTPTQLDQLEAFLLSLGPQQELQLDPTQPNPLVLRGQLASLGQKLFRTKFGETSCDTCHHNAGANAVNGKNINFNTHIENLPASEQPARLIDPSIPKDDGFAGRIRPKSFNVPPLVSAAFTPPFFHNNSINTIESAVGFYSFAFSPQFFPNVSDQAFQPSQGFTPTTAQAIAAFIRVIGSLEKIRSSASLEARAEDPAATDSEAIDLLQLAQAELRQGSDVLVQANLHPAAVLSLNSAIGLLQQAQNSSDATARATLIEQAKSAGLAAKSEMQIQGP